MSDILSKNPQLEDILRRAVDRVGTKNHARTQDDHGMVISNEGKSLKYVDSHGQHPSRLTQKSNKPGFKSGWHRVLGEQKIAKKAWKKSLKISKSFTERTHKKSNRDDN